MTLKKDLIVKPNKIHLLRFFFLFLICQSDVLFAGLPPLSFSVKGKSWYHEIYPQPKDSLSKFERFNKKAEHLFTYIPAPIFSYSEEAGQTWGLAKFNLFDLYKDDTITMPSKISDVITISTKGRVNFSMATELPLKNNQYIIISYVNYKKTPEFIFGIGNDVKREDLENIEISSFKWDAIVLYKLAKAFYAGVNVDVAYYFNVKTDSTSFLIRDNVSGLSGGTNVGVGLSAAYDTRDNRYNASKGAYIIATSLFCPKFFGSTYEFSKFTLDARKYVQPWFKHIIAVQATTTVVNKDVPFYELALMGGDNQMRGYYKGALRDKVLVDGQIEYRMPVWSIFGVTGWIGTGRVAESYQKLSLNGLWLSYGAGLRLKVDSKHNTNLRFDFGFGPKGISGFYINFAEAF